MMLAPGISQQRYLKAIKKFLHRDARTHTINILKKEHPADIASHFKYLNPVENRKLFQYLYQSDKGWAGHILSLMEDAVSGEILEKLKDEQIAGILQELPPDDRTHVISSLTEERADKILEIMKEEDSAKLREHLIYPEDSAGRLMTPRYLALNESTTAQDSIKVIHNSSEEELEMVFYLYVVDERNHLLGAISLRKLLMVKPETKLREIIGDEVICVKADEDQEQVARLVAKYDLLAIPVVDEQRRILGIITVDDVIDIIKEEATEDFLKIAGTSDEEIRTFSVLSSVRLRIPWLFVSLAGGVLAAKVVHYFESTLSTLIALAFFMPVIVNLGGNIGTQSSTIVVRGLATGRIELRQVWKVLFREIRAALLLGIIYGAVLGLVALPFLKEGEKLIALAIGSSLLCSMVLAALIGASIPMLLKKLGFDPAVAASPFVTTSVDVLGIGIYFLLAIAVLPVLR